MTEGSVGAGTGATVAKLGGPERGVKGGIGSAAITLSTGQTVAAAVAVNAIGGIFDYTNGQLLAGPRRADGARRRRRARERGRVGAKTAPPRAPTR